MKTLVQFLDSAVRAVDSIEPLSTWAQYLITLVMVTCIVWLVLRANGRRDHYLKNAPSQEELQLTAAYLNAHLGVWRYSVVTPPGYPSYALAVWDRREERVADQATVETWLDLIRSGYRADLPAGATPVAS